MWSLLTNILAKASFTDWLLFAIAIGLLLYVLGTWNYDYFKKRGVPYVESKFPFLGSNYESFVQKESFVDSLKRLHQEAKGHGICGFFQLTTPCYIVFDPEYLKIITVKYFDQFMNHKGLTAPDADSFFNQNLFQTRDQRWRSLRNVLSPAFTTSKMKAMFPLMSRCGEQMAEHLREKYNSRSGEAEGKPLEVDLKDLLSRFGNDVIATIAFGVQCDSLKDPENKFFEMGKKLTSFKGWRSFIFVLNILLPNFAKYISSDVVSPEATRFFAKIVSETLKERESKNISRPDVLQLLIQAKKGELKVEVGDEEEAEKLEGDRAVVTDKVIIGTTISFFFAGFDTVSSALSFTALAMSLYPEVQTRVQQEVDEVLEEAGGQISYDVIQKMKYLEMVVNESLRIFPPAVMTERLCTESVILPAIGKTPAVPIKKGDFISVPVIAIHHDPKYWPDPLTFDPERFSEGNKHKIVPFSFLPFGLGPRICIAQRFAMLEVKIAMVHLLKKFTLLQSKKTQLPIKYANGISNTIEGGFWCDIVTR